MHFIVGSIVFAQNRPCLKALSRGEILLKKKIIKKKEFGPRGSC